MHHLGQHFFELRCIAWTHFHCRQYVLETVPRRGLCTQNTIFPLHVPCVCPSHALHVLHKILVALCPLISSLIPQPSLAGASSVAPHPMSMCEAFSESVMFFVMLLLPSFSFYCTTFLSMPRPATCTAQLFVKGLGFHSESPTHLHDKWKMKTFIHIADQDVKHHHLTERLEKLQASCPSQTDQADVFAIMMRSMQMPTPLTMTIHPSLNIASSWINLLSVCTVTRLVDPLPFSA